VSTNGEKNLINLVRGMYFHSTNANRHDTDAPGLQIPHNSLSPVLKFLRDVYGSRKWKKIYWAQRYDRKCYQQSMETRLIRINCWSPQRASIFLGPTTVHATWKLTEEEIRARVFISLSLVKEGRSIDRLCYKNMHYGSWQRRR
jgi:hypothetical protein